MLGDFFPNSSLENMRWVLRSSDISERLHLDIKRLSFQIIRIILTLFSGHHHRIITLRWHTIEVIMNVIGDNFFFCLLLEWIKF